MGENKETLNQLGNLLTSVISKGKAGASLQEVMSVLQDELPKITKQKAN